MDEDQSNDRKGKWFRWGMVLAWTPFVPFMLGLFHAFSGVSQQRATGLGAVAGGIAEMYTTFALIFAFMLPVAAIVLLGKSFSQGHGMRTLFSVLSICWSAVFLFLYGLATWMFFVYLPRHGAGGFR